MNPDRPTPEEVWRMLEAVVDPELHSSIVDLGMVRDVFVDEEGLVSVEIALTIASCPLRGQIEDDVTHRLRGLPPSCRRPASVVGVGTAGGPGCGGVSRPGGGPSGPHSLRSSSSGSAGSAGRSATP